ncbi:hypothetical protein ACE6ED_13880 [Paenibacillus sp. CN-4]|uniref:hypothetical protein n=1 Tax=Paenibacillus nanchangensis TaxID=3348343 RepID=UPI003978E84C
MEYDHTSLQSDKPAAQAQDSAARLHRAVTQAMSHPTDQMIQQADNTLTHTEQAVRQAQQSSGEPGAALAQEMLEEERERLSSLHRQNQ